MMNSRSKAAIASVSLTVLTVALLLCTHLSFNPAAMPPSRQPVASMEEISPEFVDLLESLNSPNTSDPSEASNPEPADNQAVAAPEGGSDLTDAGAAGHNTPEISSEQSSPIRRQERTAPPQTGPTQEQIEQEQARRRADRDMANAFDTPGAANTSNRGNNDGSAGTPTGNDTPLNGSGSGTVGGGWIMPQYNKLPSNELGSIRLRATIDATGTVINVEQIGGNAPASANTELVARCIAEVRSKRYTRSNNTPPSTATALITYIFR